MSVTRSVSHTVDVDVDIEVDLKTLLRDVTDAELRQLRLRHDDTPSTIDPLLLERMRIHARHGDLVAFLDCVEALAGAFDVILDTSRLRPAARRIAA